MCSCAGLFPCSGILSHFSWLAIHALSQAAEACASPVRLGVSKPLGASSVIAEYQASSRSYAGASAYTSSVSGARQSSRQTQALLRQLHVRAARVAGTAVHRDRLVEGGREGGCPYAAACEDS